MPVESTRRARLLLEALEGRALPSFVATRSFDTGASAVSAAVGEYNGDGRPDLAVANYYSNNVSVLLGNGDGTFQPARDFGAGANPYSVAPGQFDGDGVTDLVVVNYNSFTVSVFVGNGDGTFQDARHIPVGAYPRSVAVGEFNGDAVPDLAVANQGGNVSVLLGNGDGSFQPASDVPAGDEPFSVAVADLDGNGMADLAVSNFGSARVSVLLGNGDGSFQDARPFAIESQSESVAVADFDGDGRPDLAATNSYSESVSVLLGNGDGTFQAARHFALGSLPTSVAAGDFNADGRPDLAASNQYGDTVSVLLGTGDGAFQAARHLYVGGFPASVAVGEFDGDGISDLAVANFGGNSVSVLLGAENGVFRTARNFIAGETPWSVATGDVNGDDIPDLAVANRTFAGTVSVLLGTGDGTFQAPRTLAVGGLPTAVAMGDFNEDGFLDLVVVNSDSDSLSLLLGKGDGTFPAARHFGGVWDPDSLAVGDFNGDGHLDVVVTNPDSGELWGINLSYATVLLGNGDGAFPNSGGHNIEAFPHSVTVGEVNGDGIPDLVLGLAGGIRVAFGDGDGLFRTAYNFAAGDYTSVAVADLNGDGISDLAATDSGGAVAVLLGNGGGTFDEPQGYHAGPYSKSVGVGDFDGDSVPDLAAVFYGGVRLLSGNGDGTFQTTHLSYVAGSDPRSLAVADFNGDGRPDLAVANAGANTVSRDVSILLNDGGNVTINQATGQADPTTGATVAFDVVFSGPVTGFDAADIDLSTSTVGGTLVPTVTGSGSVYTVTVTGMAGAGTVVASITAGAATFGDVPTPASTSTDNSVTFDSVPTVTINQAVGQADPTSGPAVVFDVRFSESVTGFDASDVSLDGTTAGGTLAVAVAGSLDTYTVTVTGMTTRGLVVASVPAGGATDATGNPNPVSTSTDNTVEFVTSGTLGFTRAVYDTSEEHEAVTITVTRSGPTDGAVSVRYDTGDDTARAGTDYETTSGTLSWAEGEGGDKTFTIPVLNDGFNEGRERIHLTLTDPVGSPGLGQTTAAVAIAPSDGQGPGTYFDQDGDRVTIRLAGKTGSLTWFRTDPDGDARGPIELIELTDTLPDPLKPKATLNIGVAKAKTSVDGGTVGLGAITGPGLKSISARRANLGGGGIHLAGYLGSLVIGNISNEADVVTGAAANPAQKTRIDARAVGDGTTIDVGAPVSRLDATSFGAGSVRAPSIGALVIRGGLSADVAVTGAGVDPAGKALGRLTVTGAVTGSDIFVAGNVGPVAVGAFRDSRLFAGYAGPDDGTGTFTIPATVTAFRAKDLVDAFRNSRVIATNFKTVTIAGLVSTNPTSKFGFYADASLGAITVLGPTRFEYDPNLPTPQGVDDFEVKLV
jgi:hypothetical protein